jgi:hypothetical protein
MPPIAVFRAYLGATLVLPALVASAADAEPGELERAAEVLHVNIAQPDSPKASPTTVETLILAAYQGNPTEGYAASTLWQESGDIAGVGPEEVMDGGFRGAIHLVPAWPVGKYGKHLDWVLAGTRSIRDFFAALFAQRTPPRYRFRDLQFRFVRSLNGHRPSAYAIDWAIEYNVEGSLNKSVSAVRETLFHELFHLNDAAHGEWSAEHLRHDYAAILAKCGPQPSVKCLTPYAPNDTMVRGGTFYAFQQNNGDTVQEYAAELAVRYFKEQSEMLLTGKLRQKAFKCGPPENARAWRGVVTEFFAERDLVPPC